MALALLGDQIHVCKKTEVMLSMDMAFHMNLYINILADPCPRQFDRPGPLAQELITDFSCDKFERDNSYHETFKQKACLPSH